jgi:hypothetical protein
VCEEQIKSMMCHISVLERDFGPREMPGVVLLGAVEEQVVKILQNSHLVRSLSVPHYKFIFHTEKLPVQKPLPPGMEWCVVGEKDLALVLSRTEIPRKVYVLSL